MEQPSAASRVIGVSILYLTLIVVFILAHIVAYVAYDDPNTHGRRIVAVLTGGLIPEHVDETQGVFT